MLMLSLASLFETQNTSVTKAYTAMFCGNITLQRISFGRGSGRWRGVTLTMTWNLEASSLDFLNADFPPTGGSMEQHLLGKALKRKRADSNPRDIKKLTHGNVVSYGFTRRYK